MRLPTILCAAYMVFAVAAHAENSGSFGISPSDSGEGLRFFRCGRASLDFETRIVACKQLVRDKGANSYAAYVLGQIYLEQADIENAREVYDGMVVVARDDPQARAARGVFFAATGDFDSAMKDAQAAFGAAPDSADALAGRCLIRAVANRELDAGLADCDAALAKDPRDGSTLGARGFILYRMGRMADAVAALSAAIDRDHDRVDAQSRYLRGLAQKAQGNTADADVDFAAANRIDPHVADLFAHYGVKAS
jgi:tetratricopeptide (TPR) repeat protein